MLLKNRILYLATVLLLMAGLSGCVADNYPPEAWDGDLCLLLRVTVAGEDDVQSSRKTRAESDPTYELPTLDTEKLNTLRIIIVDKNTKEIVHNHYEPINQPTLAYAGLKFPVKFATDYLIYLIGNESSWPGIDAEKVFDTDLKPGTTYPDMALEDIIITGTEGSPIINNTGTTKTNIPMSEKFEVRTIDAPTGNPQYIPIMEKQLFITRAFSKFTFNIYKSKDYAGDNAVQLNKIKISGIGSEEYLMPNNTQYIPEKYEESNNLYKGRYISNFSVPAGAPTSSWEYTVPRMVDFNTANFPVWDETNPVPGRQVAPELYFAESIGLAGLEKFLCTLSFDGKEYLLPQVFPNLTSLPRNTHVIVNIIVGNDNALLFNVAVLPWDVHYHEVDFTHHVGIADDGALTLDTDTYASFDKSTGRVVLRDYPAGTTGTFGISSPLGARWYAYLVTTEGEMNQIQFETTDAEGNVQYTSYLTGLIDNKLVHFKVVSTSSAGASPRAAILQIIVTMHDGLSVPVNILKSEEYGADLEHITFIQNPQ